MELKREQREKLVSNFKRFVDDIKAYDIIHTITIPLMIKYSNENNRYDYIKIYTNKSIFALGEDFDKLIKELEEELQNKWYCGYKYNKVLDIMNNKDMIFAELKKEDNANRQVLDDILNY